MIGGVPLPVGVLYVCVRVIELCLTVGSGYVCSGMKVGRVPLSIGVSIVRVRTCD